MKPSSVRTIPFLLLFISGSFSSLNIEVIVTLVGDRCGMWLQVIIAMMNPYLNPGDVILQDAKDKVAAGERYTHVAAAPIQRRTLSQGRQHQGVQIYDVLLCL